MAAATISILTLYIIFSAVDSAVMEVRPSDFEGELSVESSDLELTGRDFGGVVMLPPLAVLRPARDVDIARLIKMAVFSMKGFTVSARGHGHSLNGQAQTGAGVVVDMAGTEGVPAPAMRVSPEVSYVDAWGGELWVNVLKGCLVHGVAPRSWTDYLYLSVGGTLSNGGISGQTFNYGPQISNVLELDVVTGKGEVVTCSEKENGDLYHGVLGGLGQFGIITRARIALQPAPHKVRWIRMLYLSFNAFTKDMEYLISLEGMPTGRRFDYVEGFVVIGDGLVNNWRSSFFSPRNPAAAAAFLADDHPFLYCLEATLNYDPTTLHTVDLEVEGLLKRLDYIPGSVFTSDVTYTEFLDRVHVAELGLRSNGMWEVPHPWLNLLIPRSRISDIDREVFKGILANSAPSGPVLIYPMNKNKWDGRTSAVLPSEDVFYLVALLRSATPMGDEASSLKNLTLQNWEILKLCADRGIGAKQYMPSFDTEQEWAEHFGDQWPVFQRRKSEYDPRRILAVGQGIFKPLIKSGSSST